MLEMLMQWYRRRFSDPEAIALLVILVAGFGIIFFFSGLLAPLLVAIVLAYLLEWPTVRLQSIGCSRPWATSIVLILFVGILLLMAFVVLPIAWQQGIYLIRDMPGMLNKLSDFAATLPRRYPALMDAGIIDAMAENMRSRMLTMGDSVVKISLASLVGLLTIAVYLVLVPLMVFFLLKDKEQMLNAVRRVLPRNRGLAGQVWKEMNQQITNYIRGKVLEMIVVGIATWLGFLLFGLNYSLLLAVLEKRGNLKVSQCDAYLNIIGGLTLEEPAADLSAVVAIASSYLDKPVPSHMAAIGEVGLSGEIRSINHMEQRLSEVQRLGFTQCIVPEHRVKEMKELPHLELLPVQNVAQALQLLVQGKLMK